MLSRRVALAPILTERVEETCETVPLIWTPFQCPGTRGFLDWDAQTISHNIATVSSYRHSLNRSATSSIFRFWYADDIFLTCKSQNSPSQSRRPCLLSNWSGKMNLSETPSSVVNIIQFHLPSFSGKLRRC